MEEDVIVEQQAEMPESSTLDGNHAQVEASASKGRLFTQEELDRLIGREKQVAADRARRKLQAELDAKGMQQDSTANNSQPNMDEIYQNVEQRLREKMEQEAQMAEVKRIADTYINKMATGAELFDDFNEVMAGFKPDKFANVVILATELEDTPTLMYELAQNPMKAASLNQLASIDADMARRELRKLSSSISQNNAARDSYVQTKAPLTGLKPSSVKANKEPSTLQDFKNASWLLT